MSMEQPRAGQRWASEGEPELGLGIVLATTAGRVEILFPATGERRQYALSSAPLRRVTFRAGDRITTHDGDTVVVVDVAAENGLLVYKTSGRDVAESELADTLVAGGPIERLRAGIIDELGAYELKVDALRWRSRIGQSPVRGYVGARIELIPHQLSIASEVASRLMPRVLLADEVGLGKTIEAGLILHRLHLAGRASRILILVPEPLVNQWFVELLRRFNLHFAIYDEERCDSIQQNDPDANPFLDAQLVLAGVNLLSGSSQRVREAVDAGWDLVVVDEAHHLEWTPEKAGPAYNAVEALARTTPGLLLLTATPEQLGAQGHFARLRLLDPDRYSDLDSFAEESAVYEQVAAAVDRVRAGEQLNDDDIRLFASHSERVRRHLDDLNKGVQGAGDRLVADLLDGFGPGRVMFRNTRQAISGFPERQAHLVKLVGKAGADALVIKARWLADLMRELADAKMLVICRSRELAIELQQRLREETGAPTALFHEGLSLVERDRNAAYFADPEGARVLISSEIGSEGRNFQFAHHLVLFDLPRNPELLEQRIGRLDRIGQTSTIHIHVPWLAGTADEVLARWYHDGLDAFEHNLHGAAEISRILGDELTALLAAFDAGQLEEFIERSREVRQRISERLQNGYDRLLQLNSHRPERAETLISLIQEADNDRLFERFIIRLLEQYGATVDQFAPRTYLVRGDYLITDEFPTIPRHGLPMTFDRSRALVREDLAFFTWDHPFVRTIIDLAAEGERGSVAVAERYDEDDDLLLLETYALVECIAPPALHVDRFLPPTPLRIIVDEELRDRTDHRSMDDMDITGGDAEEILDADGVSDRTVPAMLDEASRIAEQRMQDIVTEATDRMQNRLQDEIARLVDLQQSNPDVSDEEIAALRTERDELAAAITSARLRLSAMRIIGSEA